MQQTVWALTDERIIPAADNELLMQRLQSPSANNDALLEEIKALRAEVKSLREDNNAGQQAIASNTGQTARLQKRWDGDGMPTTRTTT